MDLNERFEVAVHQRPGRTDEAQGGPDTGFRCQQVVPELDVAEKGHQMRA